MEWIKNGTPDTLTGTGDTLEITDLVAKKFNQFVNYCLTNNSGVINTKLRYDGLSTSIYAYRLSNNGGADSTAINQSEIEMTATGGDSDRFAVIYNISISGQEKLSIINSVIQGTAGAGTAPQRVECIGKSTDTTALDEITIINDSGGDYNTGSNLTAFGTD